jgi:hypothetical protein
MQTIIVRGGWRAWALLILGGALVLVIGLTVGVIALGVLAVAGALLLGQRALRTIGLGPKSTTVTPPGAATGRPDAGAVIDGDFHVVTRQTGNRTLSESDQQP